MKRIFNKVKFAYLYIVGSIGFFPTVMSLLFLALAILMIYLETQGISESLKENLPFLIITNGETAQTVLSSITTGIISLMVFSFTMVMLMLNQAGSNFSPRVIPGLITHKSNQKIMGLYLGTLVYTLVVMVNIRSDSYYESLPGLAVFLAMAFTILSLSFFLYFIHSISQSIQIGNILESIHNVTRSNLEKLVKSDKKLAEPSVFKDADWQDLVSPRSGYVQSIHGEAVAELCQKQQVILDFLQPQGSFIVKGTPFARINRPLEDKKKFSDELLDNVNFNNSELADVNYLHGFKQITESAVKALSPGINDPGTAVKAIDYLTDLFAIRMQLTDSNLLEDKEGVVRVRFSQETFDYLYLLCFGSIRQYGKGDTLVVLRMLYAFKNLLHLTKDHPNRLGALVEEAKMLLYDAAEQISNPGDRKKINKDLQEINQNKMLRNPLPLLDIVD
ncbi:DUF2254 domain-containing protein [Pontibacter harenae]|uniref:DUF2254 domain-containing protein n=1 Tax=Pontibacter harenae TaxID=2894083 RepID=UPI001E405AE5|nr:DUF2254 domain-containing protein [Pontibacter harenae]MCC9168255.1 DUF2254 domain-containing protein [Pontibacter harenae]